MGDLDGRGVDAIRSSAASTRYVKTVPRGQAQKSPVKPVQYALAPRHADFSRVEEGIGNSTWRVEQLTTLSAKRQVSHADDPTVGKEFEPRSVQMSKSAPPESAPADPPSSFR